MNVANRHMSVWGYKNDTMRNIIAASLAALLLSPLATLQPAGRTLPEIRNSGKLRIGSFHPEDNRSTMTSKACPKYYSLLGYMCAFFSLWRI